MNNYFECQDWSKVTDEMLAALILNAQAEQEKRAKYRQRMKELDKWQEKLDILISDMHDDNFTIECCKCIKAGKYKWNLTVVEA